MQIENPFTKGTFKYDFIEVWNKTLGDAPKDKHIVFSLPEFFAVIAEIIIGVSIHGKRFEPEIQYPEATTEETANAAEAAIQQRCNEQEAAND